MTVVDLTVERMAIASLEGLVQRKIRDAKRIKGSVVFNLLEILGILTPPVPMMRRFRTTDA
jgi:hypothetical protein